MWSLAIDQYVNMLYITHIVVLRTKNQIVNALKLIILYLLFLFIFICQVCQKQVLRGIQICTLSFLLVDKQYNPSAHVYGSYMCKPVLLNTDSTFQ